MNNKSNHGSLCKYQVWYVILAYPPWTTAGIFRHKTDTMCATPYEYKRESLHYIRWQWHKWYFDNNQIGIKFRKHRVCLCKENLCMGMHFYGNSNLYTLLSSLFIRHAFLVGTYTCQWNLLYRNEVYNAYYCF